MCLAIHLPMFRLFLQILTQVCLLQMCIRDRYGTPSFGGAKNCANELRRAEAGGCLSTGELLQIAETLRIIRSVNESVGGVDCCMLVVEADKSPVQKMCIRDRFSMFYSFSPTQYAVLVLLITSVMALETVTTCVEDLCGLVADRYEPLVKFAKDAAAGAVLTAVSYTHLIVAAHKFGKLFIYEFYNHLSRSKAFHYILTNGSFCDF